MTYTRELSFEYNNPTRIVFGENSHRDIGLEVDRLGCKNALVVTDMGVAATGLVEMVIERLGNRYAGTFDRCIQDSGIHIVNEGTSMAKELGADSLISIGGGSVIDTAKGMAIVINEGGKLEDYAGIQMLSRPQTPHIVMPTTAGTGSEATWVAVIKNWDENRKDLYCDYHIIPQTAILDPILTIGLPPQLTASTGLDALTHAVEAIHALQREPIADAMALHAIRLINDNLALCVEDGSNLVARGQQQIAATMAGIAFGNAQLGLVHAMAHSVGALFNIPHGIANSILLPHVIRFNLDECPDRYALVAEAMKLLSPGMSDQEAGLACAEAIFNLSGNLNLPQKLSAVGVPENGLLKAAELSMSDGAIIYNPRMVAGPEEILSVYRNAF